MVKSGREAGVQERVSPSRVWGSWKAVADHPWGLAIVKREAPWVRARWPVPKAVAFSWTLNRQAVGMEGNGAGLRK